MQRRRARPAHAAFRTGRRPPVARSGRPRGGRLPCVFKTRTLGYDGHGQVVLRSEEDMAKVEPYFGRPGIVEEFIAFDFEASAIVVGDGRETVCFPWGATSTATEFWICRSCRRRFRTRCATGS